MENPIGAVMEVLQAVANRDTAIRNAASEQLLAWLREPGFAGMLLDIISKKGEVDSEMRLRAALNLKVVVVQYYVPRPDSDYVVPEEDKALLREQLPGLLQNDTLEIYLALSTVLATMAKYDFPAAWPDLLSELLGATTTAEQPTSYLTAMHFIVKVLARLHEAPEYDEFEGDPMITELYDVKMSHLRDFSPEIVMGVVTMFGEMTAKLVAQIGVFIESNGQNKEAMDPVLCYDSLFAFRILDTLLISFLPTLHAANPSFLVGFCTMVASRIENIALLVRITQHYPGSEHLNKLYKRLIRFVVRLQRQHPLTFTPVLLSFLNYFLKEFCDWKDEWRGHLLLETPLIYYMEFISTVMGTHPYTLKYLEDGKIDVAPHDPDVEMATADAVQQASHIVTTFFSHQTLIYLLQTIIGRFFKIQPDRLEVWDEMPDVYYEEDMTESTFTVKNTAEHLFYRLIRYDEDTICDELLRLVGQVRSNCAKENPEEVSLDDILLKNACMSCLATAFVTLSVNGKIDFPILQEMFEVDLQNPDPRYKYIRQTIAHIIGAWVDDVPQELHKQTWELLLNLFTDTDTLVRLTTLTSINSLLSSMDLDYEPYSSCIKPNIDFVLAFLREHDQSPFAMPILNQLVIFIRHLKDRISPYTTAVVEHIKQFWAVADETNHNELKKPIVEILASLAESLPDYSGIYSSLMDVMTTSTDLDHPDSTLLLESGLRLWWTVVQKTDALTPDLLAMFPRLADIYARVPHAPIITSMTIRILESYFVLDGAQVVKNDVETISGLLEHLVATSRKDLLLPVFDLMITFLQLFPADGPAVLRPALVRTYIVAFYRYPKHSRILTRALTVFMHLQLKNSAFFFEFLSDPSLNSRNGSDIEPGAPLPLLRVTSRLVDTFRSIDFIEPSQVWACALSELFASGHPSLTTLLPGFLIAIVSFILSLRKQTKAAVRKKYTEHSDVIAIKDSTVHSLRSQLKSSDISKSKLEDVEQHILAQILPTFQNNGAEFQQQIFQFIDAQTQEFLASVLGS
jgi:hypothetical protein